MPRDCHDRKLTPRHRFRDISHMKLMNIFKSLRYRRTRRDVSLKSSARPRGFSPHRGDLSPAQPLLPDLSMSVSLHLSRYRSEASSIPSVTEEDCSSCMSSLEWLLPTVDRGHVISSRSVPNFPTSPSKFRLRSASTEDYLVDRLEQYLGQLHLGDVTSPDHAPFDISPHDVSMDVCSSPQKSVHLEIAFRPTLSERKAEKSMASPYDQNVPMIFITSVDAKHAKPLPPSALRPSKTPFAPSNTNRATDAAEPYRKTSLNDDPFRTQPGFAAYPPNVDLSFHLPAFPLACSRPYAPETPSPMHCDHVGDCNGDLWEILHPPLVAGRFTLPPFKLPPLSTGLFDMP